MGKGKHDQMSEETGSKQHKYTMDVASNVEVLLIWNG